MRRWKEIVGFCLLVVGLAGTQKVYGQDNYAFINLKGELAIHQDGEWIFVHPSEVPTIRAGNAFYRSYKLGFYKVESTTDVVIYSQPGIYKTAKTKFQYCSASIESPIYRLTKRNLRRAQQEHTPRKLLIPL